MEKGRRQSRHLPAFVLLTLARQPQHGGALHSALRKELPGFNIDTGAVYRTLLALEKERSAAATWDTRGAGPARKVYHITEKGWKKLDEWKQEIDHRLSILQHFAVSYAELRRRPRRPS